MNTSNNAKEASEEKYCASCGIAELDEVQLKPCNCCDLVKYCSDACQEDHRPEHETKCKKRAAELRDEILFRQPETIHKGDCPICMIPLPLDGNKSFYSCCSKTVCDACQLANTTRQKRENQPQTCPFCRHPAPKTREDAEKMMMKRIAANDTVAMTQVGFRHLNEGDYESAFKYLVKAAELGNRSAHYNISTMYRKGFGVEKDETKEVYHLEQAAIAGHPEARFKLGCHEVINGKNERAVKHFIIAASLGGNSINGLKDCYKTGDISKDDFAAALRAHHAAVEATKSPQRDAAAKADRDFYV